MEKKQSFNTHLDLLIQQHPEHSYEHLNYVSKKGCALIISNGFYNSRFGNRVEASKNDQLMMKVLWEEVGCELYEGKTHENLTANEMKLLLLKFAKMDKQYDYLVVYISTIGCTSSKDKGVGFLGEDARPVQEEELMSYFRSDICPNANVTKFFILDYCRATRGGDCTGGPKPLQRDSVILYVTRNARETRCGSVLTESVYEVFKDNWQDHSLMNMLTMVNKSMVDGMETDSRLEPISVFESSLVDDFTFHET